MRRYLLKDTGNFFFAIPQLSHKYSAIIVYMSTSSPQTVGSPQMGQ
jgi:hypothetical protein